MSRIIKTDKFTVQAADGRQFEVIEYTEYIDAGTPSNPYAEIPGLTEFKTLDGLHLNVIADDTFEIAELRLLVNRVPTSFERLLGGRDILKHNESYCLLCGTRNPPFLKQCINCGIPLGYYRTGEMPEGWEHCSIRWEDLYDADATHRVWRFARKVQAPRGIFSIHPSATFILEKGWEQSDYMPALPPEGETSLQTLRRELRAEGWIPSLGNDWEFWRKTVRVETIPDTPAQNDDQS